MSHVSKFTQRKRDISLMELLYELLIYEDIAHEKLILWLIFCYDYLNTIIAITHLSVIIFILFDMQNILFNVKQNSYKSVNCKYIIRLLKRQIDCPNPHSCTNFPTVISTDLYQKRFGINGHYCVNSSKSVKL